MPGIIKNKIPDHRIFISLETSLAWEPSSARENKMSMPKVSIPSTAYSLNKTPIAENKIASKKYLVFPG